MADICELRYGEYVEVNKNYYFVYGDDWENRAVRLVSLDDLERYADDEKELEKHTVSFPARQINQLPPVKVGEDVLRGLFRLEIMPWDLVRQGLYPFGGVTGKLSVTEEDILAFIAKLMTRPNEVITDAWSDNFSGDGLFMHAAYPKAAEPGFSLAFLCEKVLQVMDYYAPEQDDWQYIGTLAENYLESKGKALDEMSILSDFKGDILSDIEAYAKKNEITAKMRDYYVSTLDELCREMDPYELTRKGYAYYGGNSVVACDWKKSEEALLALFELQHDPYVANSLGYIYYSDRLGTPDYEKAFSYFSYAADNGVVEATYKLSDMYRKGHGTQKDSDRAWKLLMRVYEWCDKKKKSKGKYPDIMLRMGYCYRDGVGVERNLDRVRECFYEAKDGIELRIKKHKGFGDEVVLKNIQEAISKLP